MPTSLPKKSCETCGAGLKLKCRRDITRKRFCSYRCLGTWTGKKGGWFHSDETKRLLSEQKLQFYAKNPEVKKQVANQLRAMRRPIGSKNSAAHNAAVSAGVKEHAALQLDDCRCWTHNPYNKWGISPLQWKMIGFLVDAGFEIIIPEAQFGRFRVDALLAEEWIAFEADGDGWHMDKEKDTRRDQELLEQFGLPVVRLTQEEIRCL